MAVVKNLASVMTTADITSSATSIPVNRTNVFGAAQNPLDNPFYVTIMPASGSEPANTTNSEIALVTGISGSNLIVTRGQRSTTARAFSSGAIVTNGIYAEDAVLLGDGGTAVGTPTPWIDTSDVKNGAVTSDKIDWATLPYKYVATLSTQNIGSTNPTQLTDMSFTIETSGLYLIVLTGNYQAYGTPGSYPRFGVYVGANRKFYSAVSTMNGLQNNFAAIGILNLNAGEVVSGMVTGGACQVFEGCRMVAVRVG